jgi:hypothetical protein
MGGRSLNITSGAFMDALLTRGEGESGPPPFLADKIYEQPLSTPTMSTSQRSTHPRTLGYT